MHIAGRAIVYAIIIPIVLVIYIGIMIMLNHECSSMSVILTTITSSIKQDIKFLKVSIRLLLNWCKNK